MDVVFGPQTRANRINLFQTSTSASAGCQVTGSSVVPDLASHTTVLLARCPGSLHTPSEVPPGPMVLETASRLGQVTVF